MYGLPLTFSVQKQRGSQNAFVSKVTCYFKTDYCSIKSTGIWDVDTLVDNMGAPLTFALVNIIWAYSLDVSQN